MRKTMQRNRTIRVGDKVIRKDAPDVEGEVLAVEGETAHVQWTLRTRTRTRLSELRPVGRQVRRRSARVATLPTRDLKVRYRRAS